MTLREVILCPSGEGRGLYMVFDWAEFELSEILKTHREKKEVRQRASFVSAGYLVCRQRCAAPWLSVAPRHGG